MFSSKKSWFGFNNKPRNPHSLDQLKYVLLVCKLWMIILNPDSLQISVQCDVQESDSDGTEQDTSGGDTAIHFRDPDLG